MLALLLLIAMLVGMSSTSSKKTANPFDAHKWKIQVAKDVQPRHAFNANDIKEAKRWQKALRRAFIERLGGFPKEKVALKARVLDRHEFDDYIREEISFQTRDGLHAFAYFLRPKTVREPLPAILCLPGHGYGVDALVGLDAHGKPRKGGDYHNDFALEAVRRGYAVLALEILGFGRRREGEFEPGSGGSSCGTLAGGALMMGETLAGWRVYDCIRAYDYLETRSEVDAKRFALAGISGGGLVGLYTAAVDERVQAAVISGFFNTFRDSIMSIHHCIDNFVPGLLAEGEMSDIAGLVAPRNLWCENGTKDTIFPVQSFRRAQKDIAHIYKVFGASEACGGEVFEGEHSFYGKGAWKFLEKRL
jgi:dienelactone hydrolase